MRSRKGHSFLYFSEKGIVLLSIIALFSIVVLRLAFALSTGLGNDESYAIVTGRTVALSYFDHPPMAWWLGHVSALLFGSEASLAVRAPFLVLSTISTILMYLLTARLFTRRSGIVAALLMFCAPVLGITSASWLLPDGPLIATLLAGALVLSHLFFDRNSPSWLWLVAGLFGGLALLSKYHGIFFFAGTGLFLLTSPSDRHWLRSPWPYAGVAIAMITASPVIIWNMQNHWISFAFQANRADSGALHPWMTLEVIGGVSLFLTPWIWVGLIVETARTLSPTVRTRQSWLLFCLAIGPIVAFPAIALWSSSQPFFHWAAPGYLMLFPILADSIVRSWRVRSSCRYLVYGSVAAIVFALAGVITLSLVPTSAEAFKSSSDPLAELSSWTDLDRYFSAHAIDPSRYPFVLADTWHAAGKIGYALGPRWPVACLGADCRGFAVTHEETRHIGEDAIIVVQAGDNTTTSSRIGAAFARLDRLPSLDILHKGARVTKVDIYIGRSFRG